MPLRPILKGFVFLVTLVAVVYLLRAGGLELDQGWIDREVRGQGLIGELVFVGMGAVATALGLPRQIVAFLGGYAFDWFLGSVLAVLAATFGCLLSFGFARFIGRSWVSARLPGLSRRLDAFLGHQPFSMALLIRLLPIGHNLSTNLAAGVSRARAVPFVAGSALGFIPQTVVFALAGSGINLDPAWRLSLALALFIVSALLGLWLYRRYRQAAALETELTRTGR